MDIKSTLAILFLVFLVTIPENECQKPNGQQQVKTFRAVGEIVEFKDNKTKQLYFEENYDENRKIHSLNVTGVDSTKGHTSIQILEFPSLKQAYIYTERGKTCTKDKNRKWITPESQTFQNGVAFFSIQQLIGLPESLLNKMSQGDKVVYRDIGAVRWSYTFQEGDLRVEVDAYWSDGNHSSTSKNKAVPLGFSVSKVGPKSTVTAQSVNIYLFTEDEVDMDLLEPIRGTYCEGLGELGKILDLGKLETLAYQAEFVYGDMQAISTVDAYFDPKNKIYRVDSIPIADFDLPGSSTVRKLISWPQGVVYHMTESQSQVLKLSDLFPDPQFLFDPRDESQWNFASLVGYDSTQYRQIMTVMERGVPCTLYHGVRKDWPTAVVGGVQIETLWEMCIANQLKRDVQFYEQRLPIISLNIYVLSNTDEDINTFYKPGAHFAFNFHTAKDLLPPVMHNVYFDIKSAFKDDNLENLEFSVKLDRGDSSALSDSLTDPLLLGEIKDSIFSAAQLNLTSLRVSNVRIYDTTAIPNENKDKEKRIFILFTLLGVHPDLAAGLEVFDLQQSRSNLENTINSNLFKVEFAKDPTKVVKLSGEPGSLRTLLQAPSEVNPGNPGYSPGTMAAVAIVMMMLGLSVGAGGFFAKKRLFDSRR